ncbi:hypothetical protein B0A53_01511 [Rhodotorula sp. CCFEE 5036]|nr:hypothetical protein B0A53_01511 [Rhodotorula sp. CCFEE 5036]
MTETPTGEAPSDVQPTAVPILLPAPRTSSATSPPDDPSSPGAVRMPFKTTSGGRMVFDSRPKVESAGRRPGHMSLVRFHSDPNIPPAPPPVATSSATHQESKEEFEAFPEECHPGSGHCTPPVKQEVEEERAAGAERDTVPLGVANAGADDCSDDGTASLGDLVCKTAGSLERSWDAVKRAKPQRPTWMRWWSF